VRVLVAKFAAGSGSNYGQNTCMSLKNQHIRKTHISDFLPAPLSLPGEHPANLHRRPPPGPARGIARSLSADAILAGDRIGLLDASRSSTKKKPRR
jgi:hypothetical protein